MKKGNLLAVGLGVFLGVWGAFRLASHNDEPLPIPTPENLSRENSTIKGGVSIRKGSGLINLNTPYLMPTIPREDGGVLAQLYGDSIFMPKSVRGGDVSMSTSSNDIKISFPNFVVDYDNSTKEIEPNFTRALMLDDVYVERDSKFDTVTLAGNNIMTGSNSVNNYSPNFSNMSHINY